MLLKEPFKISARLLPALQFDNVWLSYDRAENVFYLDGLSKEYVIDDYRPSPFNVGDVQVCFADIVSFMSCAGEAVMLYEKDGEDPFADEDSHANMFPREVSLWCRNRYDELSDYSRDLEEGPALIEAS